jgi:hypothetical protein
LSTLFVFVLLLTRLILTRLALTGLITLLRLPGLSTALPLSALSGPTALLALSELTTLFIHIICHETLLGKARAPPRPEFLLTTCNLVAWEDF